MTDEAKALTFNLPLARKLVDNPKTKLPAAMQRQAMDLIETQAREIERLRDGLSEVRQLIGQPLESALATIAGIDLAAAKALAGDSHDQ